MGFGLMKAQLTRVASGFIAHSPVDVEALEPVKIGDVVMADIKRSRNPGFHRKAFEMLRTVFDNQDHFEDFDKFREWLQIKAGIVDTTIGPDGETYYKVKSLAWHNMDDIEFERTYQALISAAYQLGYEWVAERFG